MAEFRCKWALITGVSPGGMGEAETAAFLKRGINVISTSIETSGIRYLNPNEGSGDGFAVTIPLDVTSYKSIAAAVTIASQLTDGKLDFLVNNAGYGYFTPLLDADLRKARKQYDVNVWGTLAVTQAFFPLLRAAKGMVVNQASIAGVQGFNRPFMGIYSSSKAAIVSLSNTMRIELAPFDVKVVTLITSDVKTEFFNHTSGGAVLDSSAYLPIKEEAERAMHVSDDSDTGQERYALAQSTIDELLKEPTPVFVQWGYFASLLAFMFCLVPAWFLDMQASLNGGLVRLRQILSQSEEKKEI